MVMVMGIVPLVDFINSMDMPRRFFLFAETI